MLSLKEYEENRPESWTIFFDTLFSRRKRSEHIKREGDNIFQFIFNIVHNGKEKTPMHISVAQTIHNTVVDRNSWFRFLIGWDMP